MNIRKRFLSLLLVVVLALSLAVPAFAAVSDTGYSDVAADAWYADAVAYVRNNGLMSGTTATTFSPNATMTRAMLAVVLYRMSGSPTVSGSDSFTDTTPGAWYADAVLWASQQGLIGGYGGGLFGTNDPVNREQIAAILWRYAGSPTAERGTDFADESSIASFASSAVDWARANGVMSGMAGNLFAPKNSATRAQVATILRNYLTMAPEVPETPDNGDKTNILVAYFTVPETSGTDAVAQASRVVEDGEVVGNVEFIARTIQKETGAALFAIETVQTYPGTHDALLDFVADEMAANARPELSSEIELDQYDVIFLGYPIWNADLPMPMYTFLDEYDLSGKTVIPFSAHGGSGFAGTISTIASEEPDADVERDGFTVSRNNVSDAEDDIVDWVRDLGYAENTVRPEPTPDSNADVLVAYFSNTGTTEEVAELIADYTGGDLSEIRRARPYGNLQEDAEDEINSGAQPAITMVVEDIDEYEVIFIGYPIWWDEAPAMIATFLAENDFDGKIVAPFCTSAYSPIDNSLHIFDELAPEAELADGLTANDLEDVPAWVDEVLSQFAA